ncbi:hypothetical protein M91_20063 [Bos mutus]|uniref:ZP domain-containing protein n=1 Tax=Bos mutus TaxID=72004 RepID=L8HXK0_9CETA|nr:hypothetical protein M91_20063 [Bos mutus]
MSISDFPYQISENIISHGNQTESVNCAKNWLQVKVRRTPFVDELLPQVHELFLGDGCPVTTELPDSFEFLYSLTTCGIRTYESSWGILIESSVTYESLFINRGGVIPVLCFVKRNDPFTFGEEDIESDNETTGENAQGPGRQKNTAPPEAPSLEPPPGIPSKNSSSLLGRFVDVWNDATTNCSLDERVQFFISTNSKLQVMRGNTLHLQVFCCISKDLCGSDSGTAALCTVAVAPTCPRLVVLDFRCRGRQPPGTP